MTVEPAASAKAAPSSSDAPSATPTPTPSATSSATAWTAPKVTISNDTTGTWHRQDDILEHPVETPSKISQAYKFDAGGCLAIIFYDASQTIHDEGRRGGDNLSSSTKVQETMSNHSSFVVASGPTSVNAVRDDNGTLPGYDIAYTATVTYANGSTGDVAGYRFFRQISDPGVTLEIFLECSPDNLASSDTWHQFLFSTRVEGLDAGAMG
ncbi:hypothetical protein [Actinomyces oris]